MARAPGLAPIGASRFDHNKIRLRKRGDDEKTEKKMKEKRKKRQTKKKII